MAGVGPCQGVAERLDLPLPTDEGGEAAGRGGFHPRAHGQDPEEFIDLHRGLQPLDGHRAQRLDLQVAFGEGHGIGGDQDRPRHGHLFQAGRQVGRLAHGGVVHVQIAADGADHHLPGVQPDADLDGDPVGALDLLGVPLDRLLHPEGGVAGPHRVILVGHRRPEQGHDAVAHHLVHRPLVAMDGLHHSFEDRVQELPGLLGIPVGQNFHGPLQICEQYGDQFSFTFEVRP